MTTPKGDDDLYDLAPDPARPPIAARPAHASRPANVLPLAYESKPVKKTRGRVDEQILKDQYIPLWLLGGGVAIEIVAAFLSRGTMEMALKTVGIDLVIGTLFMLAGIFLTARLCRFELGSFWTVVLKLSAISVAPGAVVHLATPLLIFLPLGMLLGWAAQFCLYFAFLGMLFDLQESDTWYCVCVIFLLRLGVYFGLMALTG